MAISNSPFILPLCCPNKPIVFMPIAVAFFTARRTFSELPLVEIPSKTSPFFPNPSTWRANTLSKPMSLPAAVRREVSVVSAIAAMAGRCRSLLRRITNSAAICWASAALPPFPHNSNFPPDFKESCNR